MRQPGIWLILLMAQFAVAACATAPGQPDNVALAKLYAEEQAARSGATVENAKTGADLERRELVFQLLGSGKIITPRDKFRASKILHHTEIMQCGWPRLRPENSEQCSRSPENYLLAHNLAKAAYSEGYEDALYLVPRTLDRYLIFTKGYQKYGTILVRDPETNAFVLPHIDRATTDEERSKLGVKPLDEILSKYRELPPDD